MVSLRTLLTWLAISMPAVVLAEPPRITLGLPSEMFPLLAGDEDQRREAVSRFLESEAKLQSWNREDSFQFEVVLKSPSLGGADNVERFLIDSRNGEPGAYFIPGRGVLAAILMDKVRLSMHGDGKWQAMPPEPWGAWIDREHLLNYSDVGPIPTGESAAVEFFPRSFVQGFLQDRQLPPVWVPEIQAFGFNFSGKSRVRVQLRGPNDTLRYGSELSRIELSALVTVTETGKQQSAFQEVKSIQVGETATRFQAVSTEALIEKHAPDTVEADQGRGVDGKLVILGSEAIWTTLAGTPAVDASAEVARKILQQGNLHDESSRLSAVTMTALIMPRVATNSQTPPSKERLVELRQMLETNIAHIEREILTEIGDSSWVDDMPMRWRHFEKRIGPSKQLAIFFALLKLYHQPNNTESERIYLVSLMGRIGLLSGNGDPYGVFKSWVSNPLHRNILLSLWQLEPAEGGNERMVARLAEARDEPEVRYALVTALLATGRIDQVRREDLLEWIDRAIFAGDQGQQVIGTFHITRHPSGSKFLLDHKDVWLAGKDDPSGCLAALKARAEATLELARFDFLTHEQCQEILELWDSRN